MWETHKKFILEETAFVYWGFRAVFKATSEGQQFVEKF